MKLQKLMSLIRKAIDEYQLIEEGDRIAIGISGGKDSLTLLYALGGLRRFYPKHFELQAITISLGFPEFNLEPIRALCEELEIPYTVVDTQIGQIIFQDRKETNPCSLCAKMRKGAFNENRENPGVKERMFAAILSADIQGWPKRNIRKFTAFSAASQNTPAAEQ